MLAIRMEQGTIRSYVRHPTEKRFQVMDGVVIAKVEDLQMAWNMKALCVGNLHSEIVEEHYMERPCTAVFDVIIELIRDVK